MTIPYTLEEIRDALRARVESSKSFDNDLEPVEWENTFHMMLLLHIYDGLDIMDTRLLTIERHLANLDSNSDDAQNKEHNT